MKLTIVNLTGSTKTYLSGNVSVAGNSSISVTNIFQQKKLSVEGQLRADLLSGFVQLSDSVNTYGPLDSEAYLDTLREYLASFIDPIPNNTYIGRNAFNPGTQEAFGSLTVSPRQLQIDIQFFNGILSSLVGLTTSGGGSGTMSGGQALFSTGTAVTSQSTGVSADTVVYSSGCEVFANFSASFTTPTSASSYQKIGIYNSSNGFYIGYIGTTFGITVRSGGVDTTVSQSSWNIDTLLGVDGSFFTRNGSAEAVNLNNLNVWRIRYGWLGSAPINFEILSPDGIWVTFHQIKQPNLATTPSIQNPNLPITVDVSKTSSDSTNLVIGTACWGGGVTFASNILEDPQTFDLINVDLRNELRTTSSLMLIGSGQTGSVLDTNMWSSTLVGSGGSTISNAVNQLSTGTTANSSAMLNSLNRARFIPGTINAFYGAVRLGDSGTANNLRRWGAYDISDGVYFQLNGTTPGVGIRQGGSDTIITSFNGPSQITIDTFFHTYEIQYSVGTAYFYQDGNLIHTYVSLTTALSNTPHYHLGFENTNSGGSTTNTNFYIRSTSIMRYGEAEAKPRYFHPLFTARVQNIAESTNGSAASLVIPINATKAGDLIVVTAAALANTLTITDSASQTYSTATTQTSTLIHFYTFYVANTVAGVTSITITPAASDRVVAIVTEYSNAITVAPLDQTSTNTNLAATSWTSNATASTTQAVELLVGSALDPLHNNNVFTAGSGWLATNTVNGVGGGNTLTAFQEDQYVTSTGTYAATGTDGTSSTILAAIATFKLSSTTLSTGLTILNSPTVINIGAGTLRRIIINTPGTGSASVTFYDNTTNSGQIMAIVSLTSGQNELQYDLDYNNGLTMVVNSSTADFTVIYD